MEISQESLYYLLEVDKITLFTEEVRRLESEINRHKKDFDSLLQEKQQALEELQKLKKLHSEQQEQSLNQSLKIKELRGQLEAKEELVGN